MEQRSEEWRQARLGKLTASQIFKIMGAKGIGKGGLTYIEERIHEFVLGYQLSDITTMAMQWGIDQEPYAIQHYEDVYFRQVEQVGFIPYLSDAGGSPDGLVGKDGIIECKCPETLTGHMKLVFCTTPERLKEKKPDYYWQCMMGMLITDRQWCDFFTYQPTIEGEYMFSNLRIPRNEPEIILLKKRITEAIKIKEQILSEFLINRI